MPQSRPPGLTGGAGENAMMEARRRALQQQRVAQQRQAQLQQQQQQRSSSTGSRQQAPTAGRLGGKQPAPTPTPAAPAESSLPDIFGDSDVEPARNASPVSASSTRRSQPPPQVSVTAASLGVASSTLPLPPPPSHEATVEQLQRDVAAKQKLLQATKDRETALLDKWRAAKAQRQAEVEQLNGKLRRVWAELEDAKSVSETKVRESQDAHEAELPAARRRVEQEVKAEYEAKITAAQQQLDAAKQEEERLRQLLDEKSGSGDGGAARNVVNAALTAAVSAVLHRIDDVFTSEEAEGLRMTAWRTELQTLVQREIDTSFAVGVDSEAQAERMEYTRFFDDMLAFWRAAEDQERERVLKMDETLLTDLQAMAQQDLRRLQDEALSMERVYVESREAWAMEHQRLLQRELEAALQRREAELQEQRRQRHGVHVERLRDAEARHKDVMAREEALHQREMEQLRACFTREEELRAEQQRVHAAAQADVAQSSALLHDVMTTAEEAAASVTAYERALEESRHRMEEERAAQWAEQAATLERLQRLAATQCSSTDSERRALEDCASQLRLASQNLERHLQDEAAWLTQQEASHKRSRDEWEREYRRWQQLVEQERQSAEARFHDALLALQTSMGLLETEEREVAVEAAAMHRTFGDMEALAQREIEALRRRAADVQSRSVAIADTQTRLAQKRAATVEAKQQLEAAQLRLQEEQAELRHDEERLRDMAEALRHARAQAAARQMQMSDARQLADAARAPPYPGAAAETFAVAPSVHSVPPAMQATDTRLANDRATRPHVGGDASAVKKRKHRSDPHRLPNRVLHELHEQLNALTVEHGAGFASTMHWTDPVLSHSLAPTRSPPKRTLSSSPQHQVQHRRETQQQYRHRPRPETTAAVVPTRAATEDVFDDDLPAPLSAAPRTGQQHRRQASTQRHRGAPARLAPAASPPQRRHVDPSSLPLTSEVSSPLSHHGYNDSSPSGTTFTNLIGFSDLDTTS